MECWVLNSEPALHSIAGPATTHLHRQPARGRTHHLPGTDMNSDRELIDRERIDHIREILGGKGVARIWFRGGPHPFRGGGPDPYFSPQTPNHKGPPLCTFGYLRISGGPGPAPRPPPGYALDSGCPLNYSFPSLDIHFMQRFLLLPPSEACVAEQ